MINYLISAAVLMMFANTSLAQAPDTTLHKNHSMSKMNDMNSGINLMSGMSKESSGTSWQPESTPMDMPMYMLGDWMLMLHGSIFIRYTHQGSLRGDDKFDAPNYVMASVRRVIAINDQLMFRAMISFDRLTEGGYGYPLMFQTGETWNGVPLIDRQHPHDLFSELSATFTTKLSKKLSTYLYMGYPGEPALGPPVFMHRLSASSDPDAPIGHHWQDATHISFGVGTAGIVYGDVKLEGSVFNGREPDENRFDIDRLRIDSYSGRISYNPFPELALQFSSAFLKNPEGNGLDVRRTTASVLYTKVFSNNIYWSNSLVWGQNKDAFAGIQESFLFESLFKFYGNSIYSRIENVQKPQSELGILIHPGNKENLGVYSLGYERGLFVLQDLAIGIGTQLSVYSIPSDISGFYGNRPFSYEMYLHVQPSGM